MIRTVCVPVFENSEIIAEEFGLECAVGLSLAQMLGGLWHVSDQGMGFEFLKPFRSCIVTDYIEWAAYFALEKKLLSYELEVRMMENNPSRPENLSGEA